MSAAHEITEMDGPDYCVCSCGRYHGNAWNYAQHVIDSMCGDRAQGPASASGVSGDIEAGSTLWLVVSDDKHTDTEFELYTTLSAAMRSARKNVESLGFDPDTMIGDDPDGDDVGVEEDEEWAWCYTYGESHIHIESLQVKK